MEKFTKMRISLRDNIEKLLLAGVFLAVPLYQKFPFIEVPGTFVRIRLEDFLLFIVGLYVAIYYLPRIKSLFGRQIERSVIIFWVVGLVSLISAIFVTGTVVPHIGFLHWARRVEYMIMLLFALTFLRSKSKNIIDFAVKLLLITTLIAFVYGVGQKYFSVPVIITQNEQYSKGIALRFLPGAHITSTFAGHYDLASFLVLTLPILVTSAFVVRDRKSKVVFLLTSLFGVWLLSNTLSRMSVASYFIGVGFALFAVKKYKEIVLVFLISFAVFAFSSNLFDRYLQILNVTKGRLQSSVQLSPKEAFAQDEFPERHGSQTPTPSPVVVLEDRSTSIRLNVEWPRAIRAFSKNPLLGSGYSSITLATDNDYLRALGEVGILGTMAFLLIIFWIVASIVKIFPLTSNFEGVELGFIAGFFGAVPAVLANAAFIDVFESSKFAITFWAISGLAIYLIRSKRNQNA